MNTVKLHFGCFDFGLSCKIRNNTKEKKVEIRENLNKNSKSSATISSAQYRANFLNLSFTSKHRATEDRLFLNLEKLLERNQLDERQKETLGRSLDLPDSSRFIAVLKNKSYDQIGNVLDKFSLIENNIIARHKKLFEKLLDSPKPNLVKNSTESINILCSAAEIPLSESTDNSGKVRLLSELEPENKTAIIDKAALIWKETRLPSIMQSVYTNMASKQEKINQAAEKIKTCNLKNNEWTAKLALKSEKPLTNPQDIKAIAKLCAELGRTSDDANAIFVTFFDNLIKTKRLMRAPRINGEVDLKNINSVDLGKIAPTSLEASLNKLPENWHKSPWYYTYAQNVFTKDKNTEGTFENLKESLKYLQELGISNIYLLPHYDSRRADGGYDIRKFEADERLGGKKAEADFMKTATEMGFRVGTDLVFNHVSVEHDWVKRALGNNTQQDKQGYDLSQAKYYDYLIKAPAEWLDIKHEDYIVNAALKGVASGYGAGDEVLELERYDEEGFKVIDSNLLIFNDITKTVQLDVDVNKLDKKVPLFREFYPFQVDLDLQNPAVIDEMFKFTGGELATGVLGKRTDAIAHWIKKPGTNNRGLPETHSLQQLIKQFMKHVSPKSIILPEAVATSSQLRGYAGDNTVINGTRTTKEGDALFDFELKQMHTDMVALESAKSFWDNLPSRGAELDNTAAMLVIGGSHHDELYGGLSKNWKEIKEQVKAKGGEVYKKELSAGIAFADLLDNDVRRISNAFFSLYMMPATPTIYYGSEIGVKSARDRMDIRQKEQYNVLQELLGKNDKGEDLVPFEKCKDPRELHRPIIPKSSFEEAKNNPIFLSIKALNQLREKYSALRSYFIAKYDVNNDGIFAVIKYPEKDKKGLEPALLGLSNLTGEEQEVKLDLEKLKKQMNIDDKNKVSLKVIYKQESSDNKHSTESTIIPPTQSVIKLHPYNSILIEPIIDKEGF